MALRQSITSLSSLLKSCHIADITHSLGASLAHDGVRAFGTLSSLRNFKPFDHQVSHGNSKALHSSTMQADAAPSEASTSAGEESIEEIRSRIFGTHIGNGLRSGRKVLRGKLLGPIVASYYPPDPSRDDPLFVDLDSEKAKLKLDRLKRRGKAPPKKGAGKRSKK